MPDTTNVATFMGTTDLYVIPHWERERGTAVPEVYGRHTERFDGRTMDVAMVRERPSECWYMPELCAGSDYSGCLVHRSNHDTMMRIAAVAGLATDGPDAVVVSIYGSHGSFAVAIRGDVAAEEIIDALAALADYPILDDMDHSEQEMEAQAFAWDDGGFGLRRDFVRVLETRAAEITGTDEDPDAEDPEIDLAAPHVRDAVDDLFASAREEANEYWSNEQGSDMWIDVEKVAECVTDAEIMELVAASKPTSAEK